MHSNNLNLYIEKRVVISANEQDWIPSPAKGVWRKQFERAEAESGRVTSIVRYDAKSSFQSHTHPAGEEIFVLEGTFSDELGDYPAGTYIRNPPGSQHSPFSKEGCVLFVKLDQFLSTDTRHVVIRPGDRNWLPGNGNLLVAPLHDHLGEHTALVNWPQGEKFQRHRHFGGEEILVLDGVFEDEFGRYPRHTWIRNPHNSSHDPFSQEGSLILVKVGHLMPSETNINNTMLSTK